MTRERKQPLVDLVDRRALAAWLPAVSDVVAEAVRLKDAALLDFGMTDSAVASWLFTKCHHQIPTPVHAFTVRSLAAGALAFSSTALPSTMPPPGSP